MPSSEEGEHALSGGVPSAAVADRQSLSGIERVVTVGAELVEAEPGPGAAGGDEIEGGGTMAHCGSNSVWSRLDRLGRLGSRHPFDADRAARVLPGELARGQLGKGEDELAEVEEAELGQELGDPFGRDGVAVWERGDGV